VWCSATSVFNILIIYQSLVSVREPSLSLLQAVCNFGIQQNNNLSFLTLSQGGFSLSCKQCATSAFNILIIYHCLLRVKENLSLSQAVCNFCIQHINILSFITWSEGTFSLSCFPHISCSQVLHLCHENYGKMANHYSFHCHNYAINKSKPLFIMFIYFQQAFYQQ
jgi:hypothetical protein